MHVVTSSGLCLRECICPWRRAVHLMSPSCNCHNSGRASGNVAHPCVFAPGCLPAHHDLALIRYMTQGSIFAGVICYFCQAPAAVGTGPKFPKNCLMSLLWGRTSEGWETSQVQTRYVLFPVVSAVAFFSCLPVFREEICLF